jgi:galactose oxidase
MAGNCPLRQHHHTHRPLGQSAAERHEAAARGTWSAAAEVNLLGGTDPALPRTGWTAAADSQETVKENGAAATGAFSDIATAQTTTFDPRIARYVRLTALTEADNRGPWSSAAELNLLGRADPALSRTGWTATASDQETARENTVAGNVLDGNAATIWHSQWSSTPPRPLPYWLTIDLKTAVPVGGLAYLPRPPASANGRIGRYRIESGTDGTTWTVRVTRRSFADNPTLQTIVFPPATARYVRLTAESEAGNRGPWTSAAELNLLGPSGCTRRRPGGPRCPAPGPSRC